MSSEAEIMKILYISPFLPYPPDDGDKIRMFNLIKRISRQHEISIIALIKSPQETRSVPELKKYCAHVETVVEQNLSRPMKLKALFQGLISKEPLESRLILSGQILNKIRELTTQDCYDIVQIEHTFMAPSIKAVAGSCHAKTIIVIHNIGFIQYSRLVKTEKRFLSRIRTYANYKMLRKWEIQLLEKFDKCMTVSGLNKAIIQSINPNLDIAVIENGVDIEHYRPLPRNSHSQNLLFVGLMSYDANHDAVLYFYRKVFPLIESRMPGCRFFIVGKGPRREIRNLARANNVVVTGYVNDVSPYYQESDIFVVPLRSGGGTRLKILEAMALGRPVISTSVGCEGLDVVDGQHLLIANDPKLFAEKTVQLIKDKVLWERLVQNARALVENRYSWATIAEQLLNVYSSGAR
jgi:sugar transferase (PEP-CTERM/EpsH1 system associated)